MRTITLIIAIFVLSFSALAQVMAIPTFTIGSNDVVQSSIMVFHLAGTNQTEVSVKFAFTNSGAKRLEEFYRTYKVGEDFRWQCGSFERSSKLDDRKFFGREGFWGLPEQEAKALQAGLRGER